MPEIEASPRLLSDGGTTFWEDNAGVVVLQAEGKIFCALRAVLCYASSVFRDMFSLPQTSDDVSRDQDGKPFVELQDKASDVQHFLKALHHYWEYYESPESRSPAGRAAILRLSAKYEVPHLKNRTIDELSKFFPTSLEGFDKRPSLGEKVDPDMHDLISTIEEVQVRQFLPVIMYDRCTTIRMSEVYLLNTPSLSNNLPAHISRGIPALLLGFWEIYNQMILSFPRDCQAVCIKSRQVWADNMYQAIMDGYLDPLSRMSPFGGEWENIAAWGSCASCLYPSPSRWQESRRRLWNKLPFIFGLEEPLPAMEFHDSEGG